ncbi:MAG: hypothetical protein ACI807_003943 [Paracoccaceae bacterium]|jgi:hypothetical protein
MHLSINTMAGDLNGVVALNTATGMVAAAFGGTHFQNRAAAIEALRGGDRADYRSPKRACDQSGTFAPVSPASRRS